MPPKKSLAAREMDETPAENGLGAGDAEKDEEVETNIFRTEILAGKRKRETPANVTHFNSWILAHFEAQADSQLRMGRVFDKYQDYCADHGYPIVEQPQFGKLFKDHFPTGAVLKDGSIYSSAKLIKKKKDESKEKPKADSLNLKMRDVIEIGIREFKNPKKGIQFSALKKILASKYPALRLDLRPGVLLSALSREV